MPTFRYLACDGAGRPVRGTREADSARGLARELAREGLFPVRVRGSSGLAALGLGTRSLRRAELALALRQLGLLTRSGLPLAEALRLAGAQSGGARPRAALAAWREGLAAGYGFAGAVRRSPWRIPERVVAALQVAEETGHLPEVLERLAEELEVAAEQRRVLLKGLLYPAILVLVAGAVTWVLLAQVVPQVAEVFARARVELPPLTRGVLAASRALAAAGPWLLVATAASALAVPLWLAAPERRRRAQRSLLAAPVLGRWLLHSALADWSRSLGTLLGAGVPVLVALAIAAAGVANLELRARLLAVAERVRRGQPLAAALAAEGVGDGLLVHLVGSGEASGELARMLLAVADLYARRLRDGVETLLKVLEPALVVAMGGVVMLIVGAVLVPIVRMNQLI